MIKSFIAFLSYSYNAMQGKDHMVQTTARVNGYIVWHYKMHAEVCSQSTGSNRGMPQSMYEREVAV